jgi:hypothetical protein
VLLRLLIDLARERADLAAGGTIRANTLEEAKHRLGQLGVTAEGWVTAFGLAAGPARADREASPALG